MNGKPAFWILIAALAVFAIAAAQPSFADDAQKAVALVKKAVAYHKANGLEKALEEFSKPKGQFADGELYIFVYDLKGTMLAHPNPSLIGQNLIDVPDVDGKMFRKEIINIATTKGSGWVDYKYENPKTKEIELKTTYFEKSDDLVIACGIYKPK
jgi:signal transduction histidine kinase